MTSTLSRYLLRRWTSPLLGALVFYGGLVVASELVTLSRELFAQGAPLRWIFPLLATSLPDIFGMVLPMAAVLGGLMGTQALVLGSETVAAQGLGVGMRTVLKPWATVALGIAGLASLNAHLVVPSMNRYQAVLKQRMGEEAKASFLRPGSPPRSIPSSPRNALWVGPDGTVHVMEVSEEGVQHLTARSFAWSMEYQHGDPSAIRLNLKDLNGTIHVPTQGSVVHLNQASQEVRFPLQAGPRLLTPTPLRYLPTVELGRIRTPMAQVELARRWALPLSAASLLLLGIALGFGHPRFTGGGALLKSLGIILLYYLLLKTLENKLTTGTPLAYPLLLALPLLFGAAGTGLLINKLKPHKSNTWMSKFKQLLARRTRPALAPVRSFWRGRPHLSMDLDLVHLGTSKGVLKRWSQALWIRQWAGALGSLLLLNLLIEYANLAGDLARNPGQVGTFLAYWLWNLPPFLSVALPVSFLLGTTLALSQAALSQEWNALKSGGVSLWQWIWSARWAWGTVLALTFGLQMWVAPKAIERSDNLYRVILKRTPKNPHASPWLNLGSTGVLWYLERDVRWGFPLASAGQAPVLLKWKPGSDRAEALPWSGLTFAPGPESRTLFPDRALRDSAFAEETSTQDLVQWQRWAPDPARASLLWMRLLSWLAGPCLVLGLLSYAFPAPRAGRGAALGMALVGGLLYLGLQAIFSGAARAGEVPAAWGVLAPFLLLIGFGLLRLPRLRT